jgi:hypothetical protein
MTQNAKNSSKLAMLMSQLGNWLLINSILRVFAFFRGDFGSVIGFLISLVVSILVTLVMLVYMSRVILTIVTISAWILFVMLTILT